MMVAEVVTNKAPCVECGGPRPASDRWYFTRCGKCQSALARTARRPKGSPRPPATVRLQPDPHTGEHPEMLELVVMQRCVTELRRLPALARRRAVLWLQAAYGPEPS